MQLVTKRGAETAVLVSAVTFTDLVEGTVYAVLIRIEQRGMVDVEKVPSEKGPPRKVYSLNARGRKQLEEFWRTWSFLAERQIRAKPPQTPAITRTSRERMRGVTGG